MSSRSAWSAAAVAAPALPAIVSRPTPTSSSWPSATLSRIGPEACLDNLKDLKAKIDVGDRIFVGLDAYEKVMDACDLVILATPPGFRPLHLQAAVAKGKHIFTEKPVLRGWSRLPEGDGGL